MSAIRTCQQLLDEFPYANVRHSNTKLPIQLGKENEKDIYNISAPFIHNGEQMLLARAELRKSEDSNVIFLKNKDNAWIPDEHYEPLQHLQDPFYCKIGGILVIGGVSAYEDPCSKGILTYHTVFYREVIPYRFQKFTQGPEHMKDIRLLELPNKKILVTTRPQGTVGGRGKIGYAIINTLDKLNPDSILSARILDDQFVKDEWGGTNELHLLKNGKIGVLSHIANFDDEGNRHYYSTCFLLDVESGLHSPMKIIAVRNNFQKGESKREDLSDVIFSGGLVREQNGTARLYCGVGDAEAHCISIIDPFKDWENY